MSVSRQPLPFITQIAILVFITFLGACSSGGGSGKTQEKPGTGSSSTSSSSSSSSSTSSSTSSSSSSSSSSSGMVTVDIRGTVLLPDGQTRVNGATVYIANDAMLRTFQLSENLGCAKPSQSYSEVSCTDDLGTFVLANLAPDYY